VFFAAGGQGTRRRAFAEPEGAAMRMELQGAVGGNGPPRRSEKFVPDQRMWEQGQRLADARKQAGYKTAAAAARALKIKVATYQHHENARRIISAHWAGVYAQAFGTTPQHILFGTELRSATQVRIVGLINNLGIVQPVDTGETVPSPLGDGNLVGMRVVGDELWPVYQPGDVAFYDPVELRRPMNFRIMRGKECVVVLPSGLMAVRYVKEIDDGRATLITYGNGAEDTVRLVAGAVVRAITRHIEDEEPEDPDAEDEADPGGDEA